MLLPHSQAADALARKLRGIRAPKPAPRRQTVPVTLLIFLLGVGLGLLSKWLDTCDFSALPALMQRLDVTNFLGRFAIWIFLAVCVSVYSPSPKFAAIRTFLFFVGMVGSYYLYSTLVAGFFPRRYALIWFAVTALSPLLAALCWYAKGEGRPAVVLSGGILGVLLAQAVLLLQGVRITFLPEVLVLLAALWVLRRKPKEFAVSAAIAVGVALLSQLIFPFWG
ncbi:MAG: hypothetical protein IKD72_03710 [Clostridia bacterium]|nr:hypothetical protein [Clostridia bacterium]